MNDNHNNVAYNRGKGILYAAVAAAALFVAVLSGTFAYFQAQASSSGVVAGTIANVTLNMTVTKLSPTTAAANGTNLIPYNVIPSTANATTSMTNINTSLTAQCIDNSGYTACQVYQIKITVPANSPRIPIGSELTITSSTAPNIRWTPLMPQVSGGSGVTQITSAIRMSSTNYYQPVAVGTTDSFTDLDTTNTPQNAYLEASTDGTSYYYYIYVWLEDPEGTTAQTDNGSFTGTVTVYGTGGADGQITASFS